MILFYLFLKQWVVALYYTEIEILFKNVHKIFNLCPEYDLL